MIRENSDRIGSVELSANRVQNENARLRIQAAGGNPQSQFALARSLAGQGDIAGAINWFRRATDQGLAAARRELGLIFVFGLSGRYEAAEGERQLALAADQGDAEACYWRAALMPLRPTWSESEALGQLRLAAERGDRLALRTLALVAAGSGAWSTAGALFTRAALLGDSHSAQLQSCPPVNTTASSDAAQAAIDWPDALPAISPAAAVVHCRDPYIATIDHVFTALECAHLMELGRPLLQPSLTVDPQTGQAVRMPLRTSHSMRFEAFQEDFWLRLMQLRLCQHFGSRLAACEPLALLRYQPGEEYRPHRDYLPPARLAMADGQLGGQRLYTAFVYLSDVEAGGETDFPKLSVRISPKAGRAVLFRNTLADATPDPRTLHAGLPVIAGEKWLATLWIRERDVRQP